MVEFHEKLQELRKSRGLTQEELAEALYVSRTAISKWESGRGYPSIESLKAIAGYFSVTIDELLSGEKLLSLAEKENKSNLQSMCDLLFAMVDICAFLLIVLPLYPYTAEGYIYSVNLWTYTETAPINLLIYWIMFVALLGCGTAKLILAKIKPEKNYKIVMDISLLLNIITVVYLAIAREAYATTLAFLLLVIKGVLLLKWTKVGKQG